MSKFETHEEFFAAAVAEGEISVSLEELYQHFKARLIYDLRVDCDELLSFPELIDTEDKGVNA